MRNILLIALCALSLCPSASAEDDPVAKFTSAMQTQDSTAKKEAINALASKSVGKDDEIIPLLIQALSDRQASDMAVGALRARTGLAPASKKGAGGYPGYPAGDTPADWQAWLSARQKDKEQDELKAKIEEKEKKDEEQAAPPTAPSTDGENPAKEQIAVTEIEPDADFGKLDRIVFKSGSMLVGYIVNKRTDQDGNLINVRVVHRDQGGEETLSADLIARIDEDVE
jgi:hypothetical protein